MENRLYCIKNKSKEKVYVALNLVNV